MTLCIVNATESNRSHASFRPQEPRLARARHRIVHCVEALDKRSEEGETRATRAIANNSVKTEIELRSGWRGESIRALLRKGVSVDAPTATCRAGSFATITEKSAQAVTRKRRVGLCGAAIRRLPASTRSAVRVAAAERTLLN